MYGNVIIREMQDPCGVVQDEKAINAAKNQSKRSRI